MIKYDVFDPNHDVAGNDISKANGLKSSEIAYTTLGIGAIYHGEVDADCAHDAGIKWYPNDLTDDVCTLRIQYKF